MKCHLHVHVHFRCFNSAGARVIKGGFEIKAENSVTLLNGHEPCWNLDAVTGCKEPKQQCQQWIAGCKFGEVWGKQADFELCCSHLLYVALLCCCQQQGQECLQAFSNRAAHFTAYSSFQAAFNEL
jgi:hypothetical protein